MTLPMAQTVSVIETKLLPLRDEKTAEMVSRPTQSPGQIPPQNRTCRTTASGSRQTPVVTPIQQELNIEWTCQLEG
ncbi:hypothetical protein Xind_02435 [Xenorhabdus indica]|nr:hypothetical protein [Xenorhabdus indica]MBC8945934.1 hypothetical protein [Xenorhabdus indica]